MSGASSRRTSQSARSAGAQRPRHQHETILFAVVGMSPAVVTETVWALAHERPAIVPDRVVVLTTSRGAAQVRKELLQPCAEFGGVAVWDCLRRDLERAGRRVRERLRFGDTGDDIRVVAAADPASGRSRELDDIRSAQDNRAAADFMLEQLRGFTENPQTRLIASIAGGRKSMGALLYACMTLLGRENDRVTHVLVNEPFENARMTPRFYYPEQPARQLEVAGGGRVRAADARIELADVLFVPIRNRFREVAEVPESFSGLVARYTKRLKQEGGRKVVVSLENGSVRVDGTTVPIRKRALLVLRFLIAIQDKVGEMGQKEAVYPFREFLKTEDPKWHALYRAMDDDPNSVAGKEAHGGLANDFKRLLSDIRRTLSKSGVAWELGERAESLCLSPFVLRK